MLCKPVQKDVGSIPSRDMPFMKHCHSKILLQISKRTAANFDITSNLCYVRESRRMWVQSLAGVYPSWNIATANIFHRLQRELQQISILPQFMYIPVMWHIWIYYLSWYWHTLSTICKIHSICMYWWCPRENKDWVVS